MKTKILQTFERKNYHNTLIKKYLDGSKQVLIATKPIFPEPVENLCVLGYCCTNTDSKTGQNLEKIDGKSWEELVKNFGPDVWEMVELLAAADLEELEELDQIDYQRKQENVNRAMRRARAKVRDYCLSTPMHWFVTLTLDKTKVDRYDVDAMTRRLNMWLNHMCRDHPDLGYVMVPELHKDGAIHYHALMTDAIEATDSGTIIPGRGDKPHRPANDRQRRAWLQHGGRIVYNLPEWPYGFTTAVELVGDSYECAVNYVSKYITKGHNPGRSSSKVGGRWYYHGGAVRDPVKEYGDSDYADVRDAAGDAAYELDLERQSDGLRLLVVWQKPDGSLRVRRR